MKSAKKYFANQALIENSQKFKSDQDRFHKRIELIKPPQPSQPAPFSSTVTSHKRCFSSAPAYGPENLEDAIRHNTTNPNCFTKSIFTQLSKKNFERYDPNCAPQKINQDKYKKHQLDLHNKTRINA